MLNISPNGCTCHFLRGGQVCIACRERAKDKARGHECKKCKVGLNSSESELCTQCRWDQEDGVT